jgi:alpha-beta hydrolase superfamily lysophospholipase
MTSSNPPVLFIHGLYLTPLSWEHWIERYRARGLEVSAPAWPGLEASPEELRRDPTPIAKLKVEAVLDHYERIIRAMDRPPIIVGHSFGGGFTQVLLSRGLGAVGVGIDPAQVRGVYRLPFSTLKANWGLLSNPLFRHTAVMPTARQFHYSFGNTLSEADSQAAYERYCVPGSRNVIFTGANANLNPGTPMKVDFKKPDRAPFLFIAGGKDHVVPASVNRENFGKYRNSPAVTAYKEYPDRSHFTFGEPGWEEVADYAIEWALSPRAD